MDYKRIPTFKSLDQAQRLAKRKEQEDRGTMKGFSDEFIRPMWNSPESKQ